MKKQYRIKKESEFKAIMDERQSFANRNVIVYIRRKKAPHFRVGLSVGKKVGNAVTRNYVKRLLRLSLHQLAEQIDPNIDLILIARPMIKKLSFEEVKQNVHHVLKLAEIIKENE